MKSGNQDKAEGTGKTVEGNVKKGAGKAFNDPEMKAEGDVKKAEGQGQKAKGDAKKAIGE